MKQDRWGEIELKERWLKSSGITSVEFITKEIKDFKAQIEQRIEGLPGTKKQISEKVWTNYDYVLRSDVKSILKEIGGRDER